MRKVFVPCDSSAVSIGADAVADALSLEDSFTIVRTGSRGLYWLEPMVEVEQRGRRVGFGPVTVEDVPTLRSALNDSSVDHPLRLGDVDALLSSQGQRRFTLLRSGQVVPGNWDEYLVYGGTVGLQEALRLGPQAVIDAVKASGLRGRGGAGFPTGIKWQTVRDAESKPKYLVCNADEGDSGTFADRMLMEGDPLCLLEGMTIAAIATGATSGFIYLRSEYPDAYSSLRLALEEARAGGMLGASVLGSEYSFDIEVRLGAGSYICGEETALLESLEGKRGMVRYKPPLPAIEGFQARPTVVNNAVTLGTVPAILAYGPERHYELGVNKSRGTLTAQLCGNVARPGLFEVPFGTTLSNLIYELGGGSASGRPVRAAQVGGPLGAYIPSELFDTPLVYEEFKEVGGMIGHGGIVVFDDSVNMAEQARFALEFCAIESCGKCTPCRIGSVRGQEVIDRIVADIDREANLDLLHELCETMIHGSLCAHGGMAPYPVLSALKHFPADFAPPTTMA